MTVQRRLLVVTTLAALAMVGACQKSPTAPGFTPPPPPPGYTLLVPTFGPDGVTRNANPTGVRPFKDGNGNDLDMTLEVLQMIPTPGSEVQRGGVFVVSPCAGCWEVKVERCMRNSKRANNLRLFISEQAGQFKENMFTGVEVYPCTTVNMMRGLDADGFFHSARLFPPGRFVFFEAKERQDDGPNLNSVEGVLTLYTGWGWN